MENNDVNEAQEAQNNASEATENNSETQTQEEIKDPQKVLESLKRANAEAKAYREEKATLEARIAELEGDEGIAKWKNKAIRSEVRSSLREQGVKNIDRVMKYLELDGIDFDDSDKLVGFDEKVKALKADLPELFDAKRQAPKLDLFADNASKEKKDGTQMQVDRILGRR